MTIFEKLPAMDLEDALPRRRFGQEIDRNFLVIAPAGVGKTTALTARICQIACSPQAREWLPALVVVTYTKKAAREIHQRVLAAISRSNPEALSFLRHSFFGTIDSFFFSLLSECDGLCGRSKPLQILTIGDQREVPIWEEFLQSEEANWGDILPEEAACRLLQLVDWQKLLELSRRWNAISPDASPVPVFPAINFDAILKFDSRAGGIRESSRANILQQQQLVLQWKEAFDAGQVVPLWRDIPLGGKAFMEVCDIACRPLNAWLETAGGQFCNAMARRYRDFRLRRGFATYGDIRFELKRILENETVRQRLQKRRYRLLLDEAQDTLPEDFELFLRLLSPEDGGLESIPQGHLCLVGDPQQSIYLKNAQQFEQFLQICDALTATGTVEALQFCVTMRCPRAIISKVNDIFPSVLSGGGGQARFVPLFPMPGARDGSVCRISLYPSSEKSDSGKCSIGDEIEALSAFLSDKTPADFGVQYWGQVAILGAAKKYLRALQRACEEHHVPSQMRMRDLTWGQQPFFAWVCGIVQALTYPDDSQEISFILREIFGIADGAIAAYRHARRHSHHFNLLPSLEASSEDEISLALTMLREIRQVTLGNDVSESCRYLARRLQLLERADALWRTTTCDSHGIWENILSLAFSCDATGKNWTIFATILLDKFHEKCDPAPAGLTRIQLDTFHGSKGLEWPVVLLPFFNWDIHPHPPEWPFLAENGGKSYLFISGNSTRFEEISRRDAQSHSLLLQRLLYVAMTRSKGHLLLTDFPIEKGHNRLAPSELLHLKSGQLPAWESMGNNLLFPFFSVPKSQIFANTSLVEIPHDREIEILADCLAVVPDCRRENPSGRSGQILRDARVEYGRWWHETFRYFPWKWPHLHATYLRDSIGTSPDAGRAEGEVARFLASDFYRQRDFADDYWSEWPFGEALAPRSFLFGVIDLVIVNSQKSQAWIVDWKTDAIGAEAMAQVQESYASQLLAYEHFIAEKLKIPTQSSLYFTALGKLSR